VFSAEEAAEDESDDPIILVRPETSPEDVAGMAVSVGVLTGIGGLVSHAAVVARGWGIPAVVGAAALRIEESGATAENGERIGPGDVVTIDGTTGEVWLGEILGAAADPALEEAVVARSLPELARLTDWASSTARASTERVPG